MDRDQPSQLQIVHREGHGAEKQDDLTLQTSGGADCVLHDFRLLRDAAHHTAVLIAADRKLGETYADSQPVTFIFYKLAKNTGEEIGRGVVYFKYDHETTSKQPYCDVGKAFQIELGIGADKEGVSRD
jgi:hypothetical protein